jgi:hypothetical protein
MKFVFQTQAGQPAPKIVRAAPGYDLMHAVHPSLQAANACGWLVLNAAPVVARWDGGEDADALRLESEELEGAATHAVSRLGKGILSFDLDGLVNLDEGYDLLVTGPLNCTKDGVQPLTTLAPSGRPLAAHWRFTRKHAPAAFEIDEPICTIFPVPRELAQSELTFSEEG